jgi:hypothetical protein
MQPVNKFMMFYMAVSDMPGAKGFYTDKLGLKVLFYQTDSLYGQFK